MKVRNSGRIAPVHEGGRLRAVAGRFKHSREGGVNPEYDNATLAAQAVNAYPEVAALMNRHARRVLIRARNSYLSMRKTGAMVAGVRIARHKSIDGEFKGAPLDFSITQHDPAAAHLEWGHLTGSQNTPRALRRWVPGRHVMRNAARGAAAATPYSLVRRRTARSRRRRRTFGN